MKVDADCSPGSMGTVSEGVWVGMVSEILFLTRLLNEEVSEGLMEEYNL